MKRKGLADDEMHSIHDKSIQNLTRRLALERQRSQSYLTQGESFPPSRHAEDISAFQTLPTATNHTEDEEDSIGDDDDDEGFQLHPEVKLEHNHENPADDMAIGKSDDTHNDNDDKCSTASSSNPSLSSSFNLNIPIHILCKARGFHNFNELAPIVPASEELHQPQQEFIESNSTACSWGACSNKHGDSKVGKEIEDGASTSILSESDDDTSSSFSNDEGNESAVSYDSEGYIKINIKKLDDDVFYDSDKEPMSEIGKHFNHMCLSTKRMKKILRRLPGSPHNDMSYGSDEDTRSYYSSSEESGNTLKQEIANDIRMKMSQKLDDAVRAKSSPQSFELLKKESIAKWVFESQCNMLQQQQQHSEMMVSDLQKDRSDCCLLYTSPSPRDATLSRMPSSA